MISTSLAGHTVRIALTIVFDTAALVIWDVGTRSPVRLFADIRAGFGRKSVLTVGFVRLALGMLALIVAAAISAGVATRSVDFTVIECWALVTALGLEQLIGPDLRSRRL